MLKPYPTHDMDPANATYRNKPQFYADKMLCFWQPFISHKSATASYSSLTTQPNSGNKTLLNATIFPFWKLQSKPPAKAGGGI